MIHGVLARPAAAAMTPAPPMQRKTILRSVIAVRAILPVRPVIAVLRLRMLGLSAGDKRGQAVDVALLVVRAGRLRTRLKMLLLLLRLMVVLLLIVLLLARIIRLRLAWRERLAADVRLLAVAVVVALFGPAHLAGLLLLLIIGLTLPELFLRRGDDAEIVLGMLVVIFRCNRIAGALCVTSELKVLFGDVRRGSANFYVWPVGLIHPRQWILVMPTLAVATAHAFVLTVSHGLLFRQPPVHRNGTCAAASLQFTTLRRTAKRRSKSSSRFRLSSPVPIYKLDKSHFIGKLPAEFQCHLRRRAPMTCALNP